MYLILCRCISDRDILLRVAYDLGDQQLTALMKPSLEEGFDYGSQDVCLDFIGKRGPTVGAQREKRIQYARELLRKEVLPHVGTEAGCENKKAFFIGYMVHRLLLAELGRINQDDRDHFGKKRLDMAGPLIAASFGTLYRKMMKDVRRILQRQVSELTRTVSRQEEGVYPCFCLPPEQLGNTLHYRCGDRSKCSGEAEWMDASLVFRRMFCDLHVFHSGIF